MMKDKIIIFLMTVVLLISVTSVTGFAFDNKSLNSIQDTTYNFSRTIYSEETEIIGDYYTNNYEDLTVTISKVTGGTSDKYITVRLTNLDTNYKKTISVPSSTTSSKSITMAGDEGAYIRVEIVNPTEYDVVVIGNATISGYW